MITFRGSVQPFSAVRFAGTEPNPAAEGEQPASPPYIKTVQTPHARMTFMSGGTPDEVLQAAMDTFSGAASQDMLTRMFGFDFVNDADVQAAVKNDSEAFSQRLKEMLPFTRSRWHVIRNLKIGRLEKELHGLGERVHRAAVEGNQDSFYNMATYSNITVSLTKLFRDDSNDLDMWLRDNAPAARQTVKGIARRLFPEASALIEQKLAAQGY